MKETLLNRFKNKDVALKIQNDPRVYIGVVIDIYDGGLILNNTKYGVSTFDTRSVIMIQEDTKHRRKRCPEEIQESETQS